MIEVYYEDDSTGEFGPFLDWGSVEKCLVVLAENQKITSAIVIPSKSPENRRKELRAEGEG